MDERVGLCAQKEAKGGGAEVGESLLAEILLVERAVLRHLLLHRLHNRQHVRLPFIRPIRYTMVHSKIKTHCSAKEFLFHVHCLERTWTFSFAMKNMIMKIEDYFYQI